MSHTYKPEGYNSVSPYLMVDDARRLITTLESIFDAPVTRIYERPDGSIMHAEVRIDDTIVMLSDATEDYPAMPTMLHVYVQDIYATFERAKAASCQVHKEPVQLDGDEDIRATFLDHSGNSWTLGMQVEG